MCSQRGLWQSPLCCRRCGRCTGQMPVCSTASVAWLNLTPPHMHTLSPNPPIVPVVKYVFFFKSVRLFFFCLAFHFFCCFALWIYLSLIWSSPSSLHTSVTSSSSFTHIWWMLFCTFCQPLKVNQKKACLLLVTSLIFCSTRCDFHFVLSFVPVLCCCISSTTDFVYVAYIVFWKAVCIFLAHVTWFGAAAHPPVLFSSLCFEVSL